MGRGVKYYLTWPHTKRQHKHAVVVFLVLAVLLLLVGFELSGLAFVGMAIGTGIRLKKKAGPTGSGFE